MGNIIINVRKLCRSVFITTLAAMMAMAILDAVLTSGCSRTGLPDLSGKQRAEVTAFGLCADMDLAQIEKEMDDKLLAGCLKYPVKCYRVDYVTLYKDEKVPSSALLIVPQGVERTRYAAYFHGTRLSDEVFNTIAGFMLPSEYKGSRGSQEIVQCALPLATSGFCVIMPDYTGFGPTKDRVHPFVYYPELFKCCLDALYAGREVLGRLGLDAGKKIWLSGWSQGAGMSLYAQRELEARYKDDFEVVANSTLAGPFNICHFMSDMFEQPDKTYLTMGLYLWGTYVLNHFSEHMERPLDQIFRIPVYGQMDAVCTSPGRCKDFFRESFRTQVLDKTDKGFWSAMEEDSSNEGWTPEGRVFLHHGKDDFVVPCFNSEDVYEGLKHSGKIWLKLYEGEGHWSFVPTYMSTTIGQFRDTFEE